MNEVQQPADYTLDGVIPGRNAISGPPEILTILEIDVESPEIRCMKGDCNGDYAPG
jgi:hypothetical protein